VGEEGFVHAGRHALFYRSVGSGPPILVLHGGADFDHRYLLPELHRLSQAYRLTYFDQRGRG
jgi:proline iminopeptidase